MLQDLEETKTTHEACESAGKKTLDVTNDTTRGKPLEGPSSRREKVSLSHLPWLRRDETDTDSCDILPVRLFLLVSLNSRYSRLFQRLFPLSVAHPWLMSFWPTCHSLACVQHISAAPMLPIEMRHGQQCTGLFTCLKLFNSLQPNRMPYICRLA